MLTTRRTFIATVLGAAAAGVLTPQAAADPWWAGGARVVGEEMLGPRVLDLSISSSALADTVKVRLLLPPHWQQNTARRWPVLYLLHGATDDYTSWTRERMSRT